MRLVFIAGPFRGRTGYDVQRNVARAASFRIPIAEFGGCPVCPHTMTCDLDGSMTDEFWLEATQALLKVCHAVLMTPDWKMSAGACGEHALAESLGMPRFYATTTASVPAALCDWLAAGDSAA